MTDKITVPKQTWDAMRKALKTAKHDLMHQRRFGVDTLNNWRNVASAVEGDIEEALTAAEDVSRELLERRCAAVELAGQAGLCLANDEKPLIERFATLVRNAALEDAAQACESAEDDHEMNGYGCAANLRNLKEPTP